MPTYGKKLIRHYSRSMIKLKKTDDVVTLITDMNDDYYEASFKFDMETESASELYRKLQLSTHTINKHHD